MSGFATNGTPAIAVEDMTVAYGERPALWDVDLTVPSGTLSAIVGPNGAGKSTLIRAILGLVRPAAGRVAVFGRPYEEQRRLVAYVPQRGTVDWDFPTSVLDVVTMGRYGSLGWLRRPGPAGAGRGAARRSSRSGWRRSPVARSVSSPAASSSASSSHGRSSRTRACT